MRTFRKMEDYRSYPSVRLDRDRMRVTVSADYNASPKHPRAVLMLVPDTAKDQHWHMPLTKFQAEVLRDWLIQFLEDRA